MGEMAEMLLDGCFCEQCGEPIDDGEGQGYPGLCSSCSYSQRDYMLDVEDVQEGKHSNVFVEQLQKIGYTVLSSSSINHGYQYKLTTGTIVNLYRTGRFSIGGKPDKKIKNFMFKFYDNNF